MHYIKCFARFKIIWSWKWELSFTSAIPSLSLPIEVAPVPGKEVLYYIN
jgi:hypothetical protein